MKWWKKKQTPKELRPLGIYVHIPFCKKKCNYCDFLSAPAGEKEQQEYVEALLTEIGNYREVVSDYRVETIYFGGGTPSLLPPQQLERILAKLREVFPSLLHQPPKEQTIEVNPGTVTKEQLYEYRRLSFDRLSIGIQSANEDELRLLGRIHTFAEAKQCVGWAREAGFRNLSVDLISALPGQTEEAYRNTLEQILLLEPEHISSYSLIIEEGTPFYERYKEGAPEASALPGEELDRRLYALTKSVLSAAGYERYEISNYAKPGYESRHNSAYWTGTEYLGFGLGASSLFTNERYHNEIDRTEYLRCLKEGLEIRREMERLVVAEQMEEFMILGLRRMCGISRAEFQTRFGCALETVYGTALKKLEKEQLLTVSGDTVALTERGIDVSNRVFLEFVPEEFVRR